MPKALFYSPLSLIAGSWLLGISNTNISTKNRQYSKLLFVMYIGTRVSHLMKKGIKITSLDCPFNVLLTRKHCSQNIPVLEFLIVLHVLKRLWTINSKKCRFSFTSYTNLWSCLVKKPWTGKNLFVQILEKLTLSPRPSSLIVSYVHVYYTNLKNGTTTCVKSMISKYL